MAVKTFPTLKSAKDFTNRVSGDGKRPTETITGGRINGASYMKLQGDSSKRDIAFVGGLPSEAQIEDFKESLANAEKMIREAEAEARKRRDEASTTTKK